MEQKEAKPEQPAKNAAPALRALTDAEAEIVDARISKVLNGVTATGFKAMPELIRKTLQQPL